MSNLGQPDQFRIASMEEKRAQVFDLMAPGAGTPWEDTGTLGYFAGFFKMCWAMMTAPVKTLWQVRRPETTKDAGAFAIGCGICWGISVFTHAFLFLHLYYLPEKNNSVLDDIDIHQYWINTAVQALAAVVVVWVMMKVVNNIYFKLTVLDSASKATPVVTYNVLAYCLAPSILAIIPSPRIFWMISYGPAIALLWIFLLWIVVGVGRLKIKVGGAVIASILTFLVIFAAFGGAYFAANYFWENTLDVGSLKYPAPKPKHFEAK